MNEDFENKKIARDNESNEPVNTLNALELLQSAPGKFEQGKATPNLLGTLSLVDGNSDEVGGQKQEGKSVLSKMKELSKMAAHGEIESGVKPPDSAGKAMYESIEKTVQPLDSKQIDSLNKLTRTESLMLNNLESAIKSKNNDVAQVQAMLDTLLENPSSVNGVLSELSDRISRQNPLTKLSWEHGRDNNGNAFLRIHLNQRDGWGKSSGGSETTIGSDGRNSSIARQFAFSEPVLQPAAEGLRRFNEPASYGRFNEPYGGIKPLPGKSYHLYEKHK